MPMSSITLPLLMFSFVKETRTYQFSSVRKNTYIAKTFSVRTAHDLQIQNVKQAKHAEDEVKHVHFVIVDGQVIVSALEFQVLQDNVQYDGEKVNDKEPRNEEQHTDEMVPPTFLVIPDHYTPPHTRGKTEFCNEACYVKKSKGCGLVLCAREVRIFQVRYDW